MPHVIILAKNWRKLEDAMGGDSFPDNNYDCVLYMEYILVLDIKGEDPLPLRSFHSLQFLVRIMTCGT